jgi:rhamnosyltransferase
MTGPCVSVVIVTRNGAATLPALLDALWAQRTTEPIEIIAVDSGSTDGTRALLAPRVTHLLDVDPREFNHGLTRNAGIERARGQFVVLLVQDALPVSEDWIERLTRPLVLDPLLAGTFARQVPRADASALTRRQLAQWVANGTVGWTSRLPGGHAQLAAMTPMERLLRCAFDNVASCVRRSTWERHPFRATAIAEDLEWSLDVLLAGHSVAFVPEATVIHSHERSAWYEYTRTSAVHDRLTDLFDLQTVPTLPALARAILSSTAVHARCEWRTPSQWPRALALAVAWPLGQYAGARRARRRLAPADR